MAAISGPSALFGICEPKPLSGFPEGKVKVRMSAKEFLRAEVHGEGSPVAFLIQDNGRGEWMPYHPVGPKISGTEK